METTVNKIQINVSSRTNAEGEILDRSTLLNIRCDDVAEAVELFSQLKTRMENHEAHGQLPDNASQPVFKVPFPEEDETTCPECGNKLIRRKSRDGNFFLGCRSYPNCKYTSRI